MLHEDLTRGIIGSALEVHNTLGPGFLETIYRHALLRELSLRDLSAQTEVEIHVPYKDISAGKHRLDLIVEQRVIVELKAIAAIAEIHTAQAISYLKATGIEVALIVNFGNTKLPWKRLVRSRGKERI